MTSTHRMNADRVGAVAAAAGPLVLLAGLLWHPFIPDMRDKADVVRHMQADTLTWFGAHFVVAFGAALLLLSFLAVRAHVRTSVGREPWTARAIPLLTIGSCLFVMLPAMEIAMLAVAAGGGDLVATHVALNAWFVPITMAGSAVFGAGSVLFAIGIHRARILPTGLGRIVAGALVVSALTRFAPMTLPLIIGAVALVVAMLPLATTMWNASAAERHRAAAA